MRATKLDPSSVIVNLVSSQDESANAVTRSSEVLDMVVEVIRLASKRGRVASLRSEVDNEAA